MRYMWDRFEDYFGANRSSKPVRWTAQALRSYLQNWDRRVSTPDRIDSLVANSKFIAQQVLRIYGREARVIYPFVDFSRFSGPRRPSKNYLLVSAFAPYKRVDLAIEAFNRLKLPLLVVGSGQVGDQLRKIAGPTIDFLGTLTNRSIADLYSKCRA